MTTSGHTGSASPRGARSAKLYACALFGLFVVLSAVATPAAQAQAVPRTTDQSPAPWSANPPTVDTGRIERLAAFPSRHVDARPVDVWLPPGYDGTRRHAVLYMHDGQMLFDAQSTWNRSAWNVHLALTRLMHSGQVRDTIVVGIPNNGKYRYSEYFPGRALAFASPATRDDYVYRAQWGVPLADSYLKFIVEELKPAIDQRYATWTDAANTFVMGSSMGGLISLYAVCEYPQVFGGAAALSTHWIGRPSAWAQGGSLQNAQLPLAIFNYLQGALPTPGTIKFYMDHGNKGLDALYGVHQDMVDLILRERGFKAPNVLSRTFTGTGHSEADWSARVDVPLLFLLAPP